MLSSAGILARILYDDEMSRISMLYNERIGSRTSNSDDEQIEKFRLYLQECSMHTLRHFSFGSSTPNNAVAEIIKTQFFDCTPSPLQILSTHGVLPINSVRLP